MSNSKTNGKIRTKKTSKSKESEREQTPIKTRTDIAGQKMKMPGRFGSIMKSDQEDHKSR